MAGPLTDEPRPRPMAGWTEPVLPAGPAERLPSPLPAPVRAFDEVLSSRRTRVAGPVSLMEAGGLLWHVCRETAPSEVGRAGLTVRHRSTPSAGGLHPFSFICVGDLEDRVVQYDASVHGFRELQADHRSLLAVNRAQLMEMLGTSAGVTIRFVCDRSLVDAAYANPESLILRDAGALLATTTLIAEWLGLAACPLGFLGDDFIVMAGLEADRFVGAGGVQISL